MEKPRPRCRPFTILDGMILIAATAVGLTWASNIWLALKRDLQPLDGSPERAWQRMIESTALSLPLLVLWTISFAVLRLRRPRGRWRKVARQPGTTACMAALLILSVAAAFVAFILVKLASETASPHNAKFWENISGGLVELLILVPPFAGLSVIVAWTMLALQRQWRGEPGWIDRMGLSLGVLWIVAMVATGAFWIRTLM